MILAISHLVGFTCKCIASKACTACMKLLPIEAQPKDCASWSGIRQLLHWPPAGIQSLRRGLLLKGMEDVTILLPCCFPAGRKCPHSLLFSVSSHTRILWFLSCIGTGTFHGASQQDEGCPHAGKWKDDEIDYDCKLSEWTSLVLIAMGFWNLNLLHFGIGELIALHCA